MYQSTREKSNKTLVSIDTLMVGSSASSTGHTLANSFTNLWDVLQKLYGNCEDNKGIF